MDDVRLAVNLEPCASMWTNAYDNRVRHALAISTFDYQREFAIFCFKMFFDTFVATDTRVQSKCSGINFSLESPDRRSLLRNHIVSVFADNSPAYIARFCYDLMMDQLAIDLVKTERTDGHWCRPFTYSYRDPSGKPKTAHWRQCIIRDPNTGEAACLCFNMDPDFAL